MSSDGNKGSCEVCFLSNMAFNMPFCEWEEILGQDTYTCKVLLLLFKVIIKTVRYIDAKNLQSSLEVYSNCN